MEELVFVVGMGQIEMYMCIHYFNCQGHIYVYYLFVQDFQELKGLLIKRGKLGSSLGSIPL